MAIYNKNDPTTIQDMFNSIAERYDTTNAVMSFKLHKRWNRRLIKEIQRSNDCSHHFLDLCCGTGAISEDYLSQTHFPCQATLVDFSCNMLKCAEIKLAEATKKHTITFVEADVQNIPLESSSVDSAAMAYGIRNVKDPSKCLKEVYRILKPGGCIGILELTNPKNKILRLGHLFYLRCILPIIGKIVTSNHSAYKYLQDSIENFISPVELENIMNAAQFKSVKKIPLSGGIATILLGYKSKDIN